MAATILSGEAFILLIKLYSNFAEHLIDMVSYVHRKCQTRAGVPGDVNKTPECVTITDSKLSNRVLECMTPKSTFINGVTI